MFNAKICSCNRLIHGHFFFFFFFFFFLQKDKNVHLISTTSTSRLQGGLEFIVEEAEQYFIHYDLCHLGISDSEDRTIGFHRAAPMAVKERSTSP